MVAVNENLLNPVVKIEPILVGLEGLAAMLDLSVSTVKLMEKNGQLGPMCVQVQTIKRKLWSVAEVRRWGEAGFPIRERWQKILKNC
jgi:hypothetical protein